MRKYESDSKYCRNFRNHQHLSRLSTNLVYHCQKKLTLTVQHKKKEPDSSLQNTNYYFYLKYLH